MDLNGPYRHSSRNHAQFKQNPLALIASHKGNKSGSKPCSIFAADDVYIPAKGILAIVDVSLVGLNGLVFPGDSGHPDGLEKAVNRCIIMVTYPAGANQPDGICFLRHIVNYGGVAVHPIELSH